MPDWIDQAVAAEEQELARNLAKVAGDKPQGESAKWCEAAGCGERIPEARRKAVPGVKTCIACANLADQKQKQFYKR